LSNNLTQKRAARAEKRLTDVVDNNANIDLSATTYATDAAVSKQEQADNAKVANLSLKDQIEFSTINIAIYQRKSVKQELIANEKNVDAYEPGFMYKFVAAIKSGWHILQAIVIGIMHFWALILIGVVIYVVYRMRKAKSKK
jgi:cbb3-type cytochrome oxidase subunit 3